MVSTFTPNINLEEPARGDDVGTWDTPVNSNMTVTDLVMGAIATQSLTNANVVLSAAQFRSKQITFNSTLSGSVTITFPTSFTKSYEIQNQCFGSSAFTITLTTTAAGGQAICCPPGETIDCFNDGVNIKFKNFDRVGSYWDFGGSSVPNWVSGCTVAPYLNCDGTAFSSATFPQLTVILGGTTLPDSRGRARFALNQTTGRITSGVSGVDGNTRGSAGGDQSLQSHTHVNTLNDPGHVHAYLQATAGSQKPDSGGSAPFSNNVLVNTNSATTNVTITNASAGSGGAQNIPPAYIGGMTLIRAG